MKPPLLIRPLTDTERCHLEGGWRSQHAFTRRRGQMLLASARHHPPARMAQPLGCRVPTVRQAIQACAPGGLACLTAPSCVPRPVQPVLEAATRERVHPIWPQRPRTCGQHRSPWTWSLVAEVCRDVGLRPQGLSAPTRRDAMVRLGAHGQRAQHGLTSPDPASLRTTTGARGSSVEEPRVPPSPWDATTTSGGAVWPRRRCPRGLTTRPCASWTRPGFRLTLTPTPARAMGYACRRRPRGACASSTDGPSARSPVTTGRGSPNASLKPARRPCGSSGTTPPGIAVHVSGPGCSPLPSVPSMTGAVA
jgi:hypothetical protein